jgi:hypothetical protein
MFRGEYRRFCALGRRLGAPPRSRRKRRHHRANAVEGAVFALMGLLLAALETIEHSKLIVDVRILRDANGIRLFQVATKVRCTVPCALVVVVLRAEPHLP